MRRAYFNVDFALSDKARRSDVKVFTPREIEAATT